MDRRVAGLVVILCKRPRIAYPADHLAGLRLTGSWPQIGMWEVGVFISCVNLWRYSHLMRSSILTLWGHGQSKSLSLHPRHSHVMRKPTGHGEIRALSPLGMERKPGAPPPPSLQN